MKLSEIAAVCAWGPLAMLGTEAGKLFASWAGLNISCRNGMCRGIWPRLYIFLSKSKWMRLETSFMAATETLDGYSVGWEDFLTVVAVFREDNIFYLRIL